MARRNGRRELVQWLNTARRRCRAGSAADLEQQGNVVLRRLAGRLLVISLSFCGSVPFRALGQSRPADAVGQTEVAPPSTEKRTGPTLGIGFLWTLRSQHVAGKLSSEKDFVDTILDERKLDVFDKVRPPVRVAGISLSLEQNEGRPFRGVKETIETLRRANIPPERVIIAYNPERRPGTPAQEMDNLVESVRRAELMAKAYGAPLLVGPGLREMEQREHLYPELAKHCDVWLIQSQRLQFDSVTRKPVGIEEYRQKVKRIADSLRKGNPRIRIIVQVMAAAKRGTVILTAEQFVASAMAIEDLVDAVRIYGASPEVLSQVIDRLHTLRPAASRSAGYPVTSSRPGP